MRKMLVLLSLSTLPLLGGCLARTAVQAVTLPVNAASAGLDAATTSQAEADQKRGRELRKEDERRGREARKAKEAAAGGEVAGGH